jgi:putative transposase
MKFLKAYKTELKPNNRQRTFFIQCIGSSRFVYNWGLAEWKHQYEDGEKPSAYSLRKQFNAQKDNFCPWIRNIPYTVTESAFENLGLAFKNFFRRIKNGDKQAGYPKFKKKNISNSFQIRDLKIENSKVKITGIGWVRLKEHNYIPTDSSKYGIYATISKKADKWFISVLVENEIKDPIKSTNKSIGIDLGIKSLATCSNGKIFENPKYTNKYESKLAKLQRELFRRKLGGKNREKTKAKIARLHAKIANLRKHVIHELSIYVTAKTKPNIVVLEHLKVENMLKNRKLAKSISDVAFYEIRRQIEYKAKWNGVDVKLADTFYASSKTCSRCGNIKSNLILNDRIYICDKCGLEIDRDLNASYNLLSLIN